MKSFIRLLLIFSILIFWSCSSEPPETLVEDGYDQQEMNAAIAQARSEVDLFISELTNGNGTDFAVKAPIEDQGETEHFWLTDITYQNGAFEGTIGNEPGVVTNVKFGQKWTIKKSEISDWLFMREGKMHGNYTIRPLLKTMPEGKAAQIKAILANP